MRCGTYNNTEEFKSVLSVIQALQAKYNQVYMICGGDFNTGLSRNGSRHTKSLLQFYLDYNLACIYSCSNNIKFTYTSELNKSVSIIDNFIVSKSLLLNAKNLCTIKNFDNRYDHVPLLLCLPTPLTLVFGGSPIIPLLIHQPA